MDVITVKDHQDTQGLKVSIRAVERTENAVGLMLRDVFSGLLDLRFQPVEELLRVLIEQHLRRLRRTEGS